MGLNVFNIFLLGLTFTAFVIAAGFITDSSRKIGNLPEKETNKDLENAHKNSIWASIIGWITVAMLLIALGIFIYLSVIFSEEEYATGTGGGFSNYFINGALFLSLAGIITTGIFSILTANDIKKSEVKDNNNSYRNAIIAAVISVVTFVAIIIVFIIKLVYKPTPKEVKLDAQISNLEDDIQETNPFPKQEEIPEDWEKIAADKWGNSSEKASFRDMLKGIIYGE